MCMFCDVVKLNNRVHSEKPQFVWKFKGISSGVFRKLLKLLKHFQEEQTLIPLNI